MSSRAAAHTFGVSFSQQVAPPRHHREVHRGTQRYTEVHRGTQRYTERHHREVRRSLRNGLPRKALGYGVAFNLALVGLCDAAKP